MSDGTQHLRRHARALLGSAALIAALAVTSGTAAFAADNCSNAAIRAQQGSTHLPDCRAYEQVSAADKNRAQLSIGTVISSTDGNRVMYGVTGGATGSTAGARSRLLAVRTSSGWVSRNLHPPRVEMFGDSYSSLAVNPGFTGWIASGQQGFGSLESTSNVSLLRLDMNGNQTLLHTLPVFFGGNGVEAVASDNLAHVYANVPEPIDASHQAGTQNVYDFGSGSPELVSVMPSSTLAPACGVEADTGFASALDGTSGQNWVSADGSKVFFATRGDNCDDPLRLYLRDRTTQTTTPVSGPALPGDTESDFNFFGQAAEGGSWVFFRTGTSLDPVDDDDGNTADQDVYRWATGAGASCVTCATPSARVNAGLGRVAVSEDGSHVYFTSNVGSLGDAPPGTPNGVGGSPNLYVVHEGDVHFISRISGVPGVQNAARFGGYLTPDGNVLMFSSSRPELNAASGSDNGGTTQNYLYDDEARTLACLSCPDGSPATADSDWILAPSSIAVPVPHRAATDDGSMAFFSAGDALVPEDVNGGPDLYQWHDGEVSLITSGVVRYDGARLPPQFNGVSPDGRHVFFHDIARLTPDAAQDGTMKLYDARTGGGFPASPSPAAPCQGDTCLGPPSPQSGALGRGSDAFAGTGDVAVRRAQSRRCGKAQRKVKANGKTRCKKKKRANRNRRTAR